MLLMSYHISMVPQLTQLITLVVPCIAHITVWDHTKRSKERQKKTLATSVNRGVLVAKVLCFIRLMFGSCVLLITRLSSMESIGQYRVYWGGRRS